MAEKNILAYFRSPKQAEKALHRIKSLKLVDSSIDRFDGYTGDGVDHIMNPLTSNFDSLASLTLGGDFPDPDAGVLASTSVSASGMSSGGEDNETSGRNILLTIVIEDDDFDKAMAIVQEEGALV
ncbi:hypothetical protein D3P07_23255 [Paenibacillus sp. 1011MAR3C5]|uniref:hypothetical protein n=1 Tax=Paenibacillus sp. 1011MAR3C5 TaxID=1675787 RepID=UPI000E6C803F|nr:hypothetical protein [Paenibacillus sp. 1011MAR3C5]RJE84289.1 hypothetical protein D3P07_23255 [Paenibacillus sp. 1011MAR3C5]